MSNLNTTTGFNKAGKKTTTPIEVGLFIPPAEDSSNRVINHLAEKVIGETNINLTLFLTRQPEDSRIDASPTLSKKKFLHSTLLKEIVFPFLEQNKENNPRDIFLPPKLLAEKFLGRIKIIDVDDPNDPDFIKNNITNNENMKMAFSVRNLVIFKPETINAFREKGVHSFINLHPAKLPGIRGLEGPFWTRVVGESEYRTTMHVVHEIVDAGDILDYETKKANGKPIATYTRDAAPDVASMIHKHIQMIAIDGAIKSGIVQNIKDSSIFTLPTQTEIQSELSRLAVKFVDGNEQIQYLLANYANEDEGQSHHAALMGHIWDAYANFKNGRYTTPRQNSLVMDENLPQQITQTMPAHPNLLQENIP